MTSAATRSDTLAFDSLRARAGELLALDRLGRV
jgi:hypothetical protein